MTGRLLAWAARLRGASTEEVQFEEWIMTAIAGVLLAKKAGELIVLSRESAGLTLPRQLEALRGLVGSLKLSSLTVCHSEHCAKVVIYRAEKVEATLSEVPRWVLERLGYPIDAKPAACHIPFIVGIIVCGVNQTIAPSISTVPAKENPLIPLTTIP